MLLTVRLLSCGGIAPGQENDGLPRSAAVSGEELLERLKSADAAFLAAVTVEARRESPGSSLSPTTIRLTAAGPECVLTVWRDPPKFQAPGTRPPEHVRPGMEIQPPNDPAFVKPGGDDAEGNQRQLSRDRSEFLFLPEKSGSKETTIDYLLSPAGKVLKQADSSATVRFFPPDAPDLLAQRAEFLWTIGRWYSPFLQEIVQVESREDGLIKVVANGTAKGLPGTWELTVDSRRGDLVRSAVFTLLNGRRFLEISNKGELSAGDRVCAREGEHVVLSRDIRMLTVFVVGQLKDKLDQGFFDSTVAAITGKPGPRTHLHDRRQPLEIHQYTNGDGVTSPPRYPTNQVPEGVNIFPVLPDEGK